LIWATRIRFEGTIKVQFESSLQHKEVQKLQRTNNKHSKQVVENTKSKGNLICLPSSIIWLCLFRTWTKTMEGFH